MALQEALRGALQDGIDTGVFVGASASVAYRKKGRWCRVDVARGEVGERRGGVTTGTIYDLASLTKPVVATCAARMAAGGEVVLETAIGELIPEIARAPVADASLVSLLEHISGLKAWVPFYEELEHPPGSDDAESWIVQEAAKHLVDGQAGTRVYSDLGYILAGVALARCQGETLNRLVSDYVTKPFELSEELFFAAAKSDPDWVQRAAPTTGLSEWRPGVLMGDVHDDNCFAFGSIAGHAGMFGTARAVTRFGCAIVDEADTRPIGWDEKAEGGSAAGTLIGANAFGHLGFTGTSIWCDPEREVVITLLSNRVYPDPDNVAIREFRPGFHDLIVEAADH